MLVWGAQISYTNKINLCNNKYYRKLFLPRKNKAVLNDCYIKSKQVNRAGIWKLLPKVKSHSFVFIKFYRVQTFSLLHYKGTDEQLKLCTLALEILNIAFSL